MMVTNNFLKLIALCSFYVLLVFNCYKFNKSRLQYCKYLLLFVVSY